MASNKYQELVGLSDADLAAELEKTVNEYQKLKFDHAITGLANPIQLRDVRKDVARMNTEIRKREMSTFTPEQIAARTKTRKRRRNNNK